MISENLVFIQLAQQEDYISIVELAMMLSASVSQVRHRLKGLGDRVEHNERDEWRVIRNLIPERDLSLLSVAEKEERDALERSVEQAFFVAGL